MPEFDLYLFAFQILTIHYYSNNNSRYKSGKTNRVLMRIVEEELSESSNGNAKTALLKV